MVQTFRDGQLLRASDLNSAFSAVKTESFNAAVGAHENEIYVRGTWYKRTGVVTAPSHKRPEARGALYGGSFRVTSISVPPGYTVAYSVIDAGAGYAYCMTDASDPQTVWYASTAADQIKKISWTLVKVR